MIKSSSYCFPVSDELTECSFQILRENVTSCAPKVFQQQMKIPQTGAWLLQVTSVKGRVETDSRRETLHLVLKASILPMRVTKPTTMNLSSLDAAVHCTRSMHTIVVCANTPQLSCVADTSMSQHGCDYGWRWLSLPL